MTLLASERWVPLKLSDTGDLGDQASVSDRAVAPSATLTLHGTALTLHGTALTLRTTPVERSAAAAAGLALVAVSRGWCVG